MLEETLTYALIIAMKQKRHRMAAAMAPLGLHVGQEFLLNKLWHEDGLTQSELIARLGVEPPTVTKTIQRLERAGFLRRSRDADRPRVSRVWLTDAGRALREPVERIWAELDEELVNGLGEEERELLAGVLERAVRRSPHAPKHTTKHAPERATGR
ncbi:MarR family winged helix-turn-helix transcriptional regulator [Nonomuraea rhizosphaerae]|uniref:MarR family winged helix-turn-helix transcriptional regulator n=1 Tax=Nonomuraea rhizosphaerae TaxID=2665663 RepID=UPI001C5D917C|nr:MarR family transcriptional regulator [Nonomuraea rhizosphaerae]